jgi:hypothetical protein
MDFKSRGLVLSITVYAGGSVWTVNLIFSSFIMKKWLLPYENFWTSPPS